MGFQNGWRGPDIVADGLVLYLDAGSPNSYRTDFGTTWKDMSGFNNSGSLINGPTYSSANGGSIVFDGTNDYAATTYTQPAYGTATSFTWNIWTNPDALATNRPIIGNRGTNLNFCKLTRSAFEYYPSIISYSMTANVWQNISIVKNGTSFTYYQNGVSVATMTSSITKSANSFYIGGDPTADEYSKGYIANVIVYHRALSASEILQNYNATKTRFGL
jgi:hypothetical protein